MFHPFSKRYPAFYDKRIQWPHRRHQPESLRPAIRRLRTQQRPNSRHIHRNHRDNATHSDRAGEPDPATLSASPCTM